MTSVHRLIILFCALLTANCTTTNRKKVSPVVAYREVIANVSGSSLTSDHLEAMSKACKAGSQPACLATGSLEFEKVARKLSILQGYTNSSSTQINVVAAETEQPEFILWDLNQGKLLSPQTNQRVQRPGVNSAVFALTYNGLSVDKRYRLDVISKDGELLDSRILQALSPDLPKARVAIASCINDQFEPHASEKIWAALGATKPNLVLFIGDNVYADWDLPEGANPEKIWARYIETRKKIPYYRWSILVPTLATWDDHDFGKNDSDGTYPYKDESANIFRLFFPQEPDGANLRLGPGVARVYRAFGQKIILLDDRSFRSPPKSAAAEQTLFGQEQEKWLMSELAADTQTTWLVNGFQFFGGYHTFESYEGSHPESFQHFKKQLKEVKKPLWFVSGDRHLAELMEISSVEFGRRTWELTTSAIQSKTYPARWHERPNPRQIAGADQQLNFAIVDVQKNINSSKLNIKVFGDEGQNLFSKEVEVRR